jgi:phospholipid/cholesterol/gamma-HCH transport system substrate-binding protein
VGTQVLFAGRPVGEVTSVEEIYDARKQPNDSIGRVYYYQLKIKVDSSVNIYSTDDVAITTSGLLGEKSISITPKVPPKGVAPKLITSQPIYADSIDPLENAFYQLSILADKAGSSFEYINDWLKNNSDNISQAITSFKNAMSQVDIAIGDFNRLGVINDVHESIAAFKGLCNSTQKVVDDFEKNGVFAQVGTISKHLASTSQNLDVITDDLATGKGTLGKLIKNDDMYLRVTAILSKMDTLMNDVNHYGVLFHLNKSWQRERLQRINLMSSLDSPNAFRIYFEKEVDSVNMAMSRLSMLIQKAESSPNKDNILNNQGFKDDFAQLLKDVDELSDNLKLYNEQLNSFQQNNKGSP